MATKKKTATKKASPEKVTTKADAAATPKKGDLCTFAIRLPIEDRNAIHEAAGPRGASRFAREVLVAAARGYEKEVRAAMANAKGTHE